MAVHVTIEGYEGALLSPREVWVREALSTLYTVEVDIEARELIEPETLLGKTASVSFRDASDEPDRFFHGLIFEASLETAPGALDGEVGDDRYGLSIVIRPRFAQLEIGQNARIIQEKNVPDAVAQIFEEAALPAEAVQWDTQATYEELDYITQFGESDYDFVARLLASEGIGYFVGNDFDEERIFFFDDDTAFQPCEREPELPFGTPNRYDSILALEELHRAGSDKVTLRDYDLEKPSTDLTCTLDAEASTGREVYMHPGGFSETGRGDRLTQVTLERLTHDALTFRGTSDAPQLEPGRTFDVIQHPRLDLNGPRLVLSVEHFWDRAGGYTNRFVCIPSDVPYRPPVGPPAPQIGGNQVAFVTGPSGQELHGSERGQVKTRFVWDRSGITDDTSSTWLRVGQFALPGSMVIPRVGFEVLVDFEMGDNDRPMVSGHFYNGEAMPPYALPDEATKGSIQTATTDGGSGANELRFDDTAGSEELFINASYDQTTDVENNATVGVLANETVSIGGNSTFKVTGDYTSNVGGTRSLSVGGNQNLSTSADYNDGTSGDLSVTVGSRSETVGGDLTEATTGTYDRTVGGLMSLTGIKGINRSIVGSSTTKVGAAWLEIVAGDRQSQVGGTRTETIGALKMTKAETVSIGVGSAYLQNCASETIKAGGSETQTADAAVGMVVGGKLSIDATNINISGDLMVIVKVGGTKIQVTPASVTIKSSKIKLTGVKALKSTASHETT